jgi:biotin carboxylase
MTATVVFVEANLTGTTTEAMKTARIAGYTVVLFVSSPDFYAAYPNSPIEQADEVVVLDTYDPQLIAEAASKRSAEAIVAFDDYHLVPAAVAAAALGLRSPSPESLAEARSKRTVRARLASEPNHVPFGVVEPPSVELPTVAGLDFPVIAKPIDEAGSLGVERLDDAQALRRYVREHAQRQPNGRGFISESSVLVERYIEGTEYSAEAVNTEAGWEVVAVTRKHVSEPPFFVEKAHICGHFTDCADAIRAAVHSWLAASGAQYAAAHVEFRVDTAATPRLIEINPRLPGGHIADLVKIVHGRDIVIDYLNYFLPKELRLDPFGSGWVTSESAAIVYDPSVEPERLRSDVVVSTEGVSSGASSVETPRKSNFDRGGYLIIRGSRDEVTRDLAILT